MSNWILDMPRIWRLYSRVRGVALSQERFQFFFKSEEDLIEILKSGVWTQDEWCVLMERWVEKPSDDSLLFLPVWIRLRNIPINYYTEDTIKEIAGCVGKVLTVELDLEKSQAQNYIRVQVLFDVRNPLRNFKEVLIPSGELISVSFDYERIRKRCFLCQRLTHEKSVCPFVSLGNSKESKKDLSFSDSGFLDGKSCLVNPGEKIVPTKLPSLSADQASSIDSEGFPFGFNESGASGLSIKQKNPRKRKASIVHNKQAARDGSKEKEVSLNVEFANAIKRKKEIADLERVDCMEKAVITVVPQEPPQYQ